MKMERLLNLRIWIVVATCFAAMVLTGGSVLAQEKSGTIGVSMPNIKGPWFTPVLYGISDEAKKLGYSVNIQDAGGYANVDKQVTQLSNLIVQRVKAILMDPADPTAFNGAVRKPKMPAFPF